MIEGSKSIIENLYKREEDIEEENKIENENEVEIEGFDLETQIDECIKEDPILIDISTFNKCKKSIRMTI